MDTFIDNILILSALGAIGLACGLYCAKLAELKGHSMAAWMFGGFFFSLIALIAAAGLPDRKKQ